MKEFLGGGVREWTSVIAAIALGPGFLLTAYHLRGLMYGAAAGATILLWALVIPLLTISAGHFRFFVWQLSIISIVCTIVGDNLRLNAIHRSEVAALAFVFWAGGTLFSAPVPVYLFLRQMDIRQRYIWGVILALVALVLAVCIKRITR